MLFVYGCRSDDIKLFLVTIRKTAGTFFFFKAQTNMALSFYRQV